ncbi:MAG: ABC transporter substrate-binding protein [Desulfobacterales bacterium]
MKEAAVKNGLWCCAIFLLGVMAVPAMAGAPVDALKGPVDKAIQILEDPQYDDPVRRDELREKIRSVTNAMFDFELIAKRTAGRYHWEKSMTPPQRREFTDLFAEFLGNNYLSRINGTVKGLKIEYVDEVVDDAGKKAKVKTRIPRNDGDVNVDYNLWLKDGNWKIYDVYVEGVSLVQNYQTQFSDLFNKESAAQVIDRLKQKIGEQKQQEKTNG